MMLYDGRKGGVGLVLWDEEEGLCTCFGTGRKGCARIIRDLVRLVSVSRRRSSLCLFTRWLFKLFVPLGIF